jgi:hypothetical protein
MVPSSKGGFISADPVQLCLKYKPPTIAVVYYIIKPSKSIDVTNGSPESTKEDNSTFLTSVQ